MSENTTTQGAIILQKAKVLTDKKGVNSLLMEYAEVINKDGKVYVVPHIIPDCQFEPHPDLLSALKLLVPHWTIDAEEIEPKKFNKAYFKEYKALSDQQLERFKVTGIKIFEKNEQEHVIIFGRKILKTGKVINHSPVFNMEPSEESGYVFIEELKAAVELVRKEIDDYKAGKYAPDNQLKLFPKGTPKPEEESGEVPPKKTKAG